MANGWSKEMQAALQADAEKLSAESGEEHKIVFSDDFDPLNEIERLRAAAAGEETARLRAVLKDVYRVWVASEKVSSAVIDDVRAALAGGERGSEVL